MALSNNWTLDVISKHHESLYSETDYNKKFRFPFIELALNLLLKARSTHVKKYTPKSGAVLDIGCGRGDFMVYLRKQGYQVSGTELDIYMKNLIPESLSVFYGSALSLHESIPQKKYDTIILWHVFEHVSQPSSYLDIFSKTLSAKGHLIICVPNFESWQSRFFKENWFHLDLPRHLYHFTHRGLKQVCEKHSLTLVESQTGQIEMDLFGFIQSFFNSIGFRQNLLYDFMRAPGKTVSQRFAYLQLSLCLALLPISLIFGCIFYYISRTFGQAGTLIHTYSKNTIS